MAKTKKRESRIIRIKCDFLIEIYNLFQEFSSQLSDGYWEGSRGDYGSYGDGYYEDIWNCFDFDTETDPYFHRDNDCFIIELKGSPTWDSAKADCDKMHGWTDKQIADYLSTAICYSMEEHPEAFRHYSDYELEVFTKCIKEWKILPPPLPKLTHQELVEKLGYDFEYIK